MKDFISQIPVCGLYAVWFLLSGNVSSQTFMFFQIMYYTLKLSLLKLILIKWSYLLNKHILMTKNRE